jgi:alpha,alpha-trehalase
MAATLASAATARSGPKALPGPCDDVVYCATGPNTILHTVQMARIYNDSKTFVDKPMSQPRATVVRNFDIMMQVFLTDKDMWT